MRSEGSLYPPTAKPSRIDHTIALGGVDGIFFDQASTDCSHARSYYKDLYSYVNGKDGRVVLNPGTQTNECYMAVADIVVNFEDTYANYARTRFATPRARNSFSTMPASMVLPSPTSSQSRNRCGYVLMTLCATEIWCGLASILLCSREVNSS